MADIRGASRCGQPRSSGGRTSAIWTSSSRSTIRRPTQPWSVTVPFELLPDTDLIENICENEKDVVHIFGK
jgi:hypothetical protein